MASQSSLSLVQIIDTSLLWPASPDPDGIVYLSATNSFLVTDSEVNEIPSLFTGDNLFQITATGELIDTGSTLAFSSEPTDVTINPSNNHIFITDDDRRKVFEIDPGKDSLYGTSDDKVVNSFSTLNFGCDDPEGITYNTSNGTLFVLEGAGTQVYQVTTSGQVVSQFDTASFGLQDPEGIEYDPSSGHLYMVGKPPNSLFEVTTSGTLVQVYDISAANAVKPAGLGIGPSSTDPTKTSIYITDRGVDNNENPKENDGKIYEFRLPGSSSTPTNQAPNVNAGVDQTLSGLSASLNATITDDGLPSGSLASTWTLVSGPGTVSFGNASAEDTTVTFSSYGTYVLQLAASDGSLSSSDQVSITVQNTTPPPTSGNIIYVASNGGGSVGGVAYDNEDILAFNEQTQTWSTYFDGSDVGLSNVVVEAFYLQSDGSILLSFNTAVDLAGLGTVEDADIVKFTPTSTGTNTAGTWSMYLDGSDVGLTTSNDDIRAIGFAPNGDLLISTKGSSSVVSGSKDEDILVFKATSLGTNTAGTWGTYFDGSDVGLSDSGEDIDSVWVDNSGKLYLSSDGNFTVPGINGDGNDIVTFTPTSLGSNTSGSFNLYWDGNAHGFTGELTGFQVVAA